MESQDARKKELSYGKDPSIGGHAASRHAFWPPDL